MKTGTDPSNRSMKKFLMIMIACVLALAASAQAQGGDAQQASKKQRQNEREAAQEAQPGATPQAQHPVARAHPPPKAYAPGAVNHRARRRIPPASVPQQHGGDQIPQNPPPIQNPPAAPATVAANDPGPAPTAPKANRLDRRVAVAPGEKPDVQKIRTRHATFTPNQNRNRSRLSPSMRTAGSGAASIGRVRNMPPSVPIIRAGMQGLVSLPSPSHRVYLRRLLLLG